ncbi:MAG: fumarylacetoacetate hydrolase family protein [Micropruina sp.]|nr:fumarylacetoacetate hydrolase family protein [Micropruina sp.]
MQQHQRGEATRALLDAYREGPVAPLSATYPELDIEAAYAIQLAQVDHWRSQGRTVAGTKVGLTSLAVQKQLGVDQPDFGHLMADTFYASEQPIAADAFLQPRIEPEIAFVLKHDLAGPGVTTAQAIRAVDFVLASMEIVDSRIADWKITITDTIADNASCGGVVLGSKPQRLDAADLRLLGAVLYRNGQLVHTGAGAAVMGSPIAALVWLANTLGRLGTTLQAGSVVLPGAITPMIPVVPGDVVTANFAGLGTVTARFARQN